MDSVIFYTSCWEGLQKEFSTVQRTENQQISLKEKYKQCCTFTQLTDYPGPSAWSFSDSYQQEKQYHSNTCFQHKLAEDVISPALEELRRKMQSQLFYLKITL